jgi:hypothetical protein
MAGRGPAPKAPEDRRRRNAPAAGEWVDLPELAARVLPNLPQRGKGRGAWSARTRAAWKAWQKDPVTSQYGPADVQLAVDLAWLYEDWVREPTVALAGEIRQRMDTLGLSPKGRQDRRWRLQPVAEVVPIDQARPARESARDRMRKLAERAAVADSVAG